MPRRLILAAVSASLLAPALPALAAEAAIQSKPASVEPIAGTKIKKVTLTQKAAQRIDVQTAEVRDDGAGRTIVPYAALIYDVAGKTWIYVSPEPLTFQRHAVTIETIKGADAVLKEGPAKGAKVLVVGVPEIYGVEVGVGH